MGSAAYRVGVAPLVAVLLARLIVATGEARQETATGSFSELDVPLATLSRLGPISGRFVQVSQTTPVAGSGHDRLVAVFAGIPYAAAPVGPLRFMPPGAAAPSPAASSLRETKIARCGVSGKQQPETNYVVWSGQRVRPRPFSEPGPSCVRLYDWLPEASRGDVAQQQQSEECLNINIYVPVGDERRRELLSRRGRSHTDEAAARGTRQRRSVSEDDETSFLTDSMSPPHEGRRAGESRDQSEATGRIKSNYPSEDKEKRSISPLPLSTTAAVSQQTTDNSTDSDKADCADQKQLHFWPIIQQQQTGTISADRGSISSGRQSHNHTATSPVLVRIRSQSHRLISSPDLPINSNGTGNSDNQGRRRRQQAIDANAMLASRLGAIVVDFEYRSGLLGFLPFSESVQSLGSAATASSGARQNHAIWDQIGALHWLKRNIGHFNGNANNLTVVASDNEANKFVQLLVQSPIAKGLFNRAVLVHNASRREDQAQPFTHQPLQNRPVVSMRNLLDMALEARELGKRLAGALSDIVESKLLPSNRSSSSQVNERNVFEWIQSCDLVQLAVIENELRKLQLTSMATVAANSSQRLQSLLFALATEPNLDDPILFPHLSERLKRAKSLQQRSSGLMAKLAMNRQRSDPNSALVPNGTAAASNGTPANQNPTTLYSDIVYDSILLPSFVSPSSAHNLTSTPRLRAEVAYCCYMRQIGKNLLSDTLALLPRQQGRSSSSPSYDSSNDTDKLLSEKRSRTHDSAAAATAAHRVEWHRDSSSLDASALQRRHLAAAEFDHLRQVHLVKQSLHYKLDAPEVAQKANGMVNTDDNNEEDDDLYQVAYRQQYRTILLNFGGHSSSASSVSRRRRQYNQFDTTSDGSEYNAIPLGSIDLMLGFIGSPKRRVDGPSSNKIVQPMAALERANITYLFEEMAQELDDTLLMWFKLADVNYLRNFVDNRTLLTQLCDFGTNIHLDEQLKRKTYLFVKYTNPKPLALTKASTVAIDSDLNSDNANDNMTSEQRQDWISEEVLSTAAEHSDSQNFKNSPGVGELGDETPVLIDGLRQFIYFGEPEPKQWPPYDSLNRPFRQFSDGRPLETDLINHHSSLSLDMLPYLRSTMTELLRNPVSGNRSRSSQTIAAGAQQTARQSHFDPVNEWFTCLSDLNAAIGRWRESLANGNDSLAPVRLREEAQCLTNSELKLRLKVRRSALDDLEILLLSNGTVWSSEMTSGSDLTSGRGTNAELLRVLHEASGEGGSTKLHRTSVTTRNSGESDSGSYEYANHLIDSTSASNFTNGMSSTTGSSLRGFFAKAYKDSIGQALAMVVGTGLLIFLLNLIIVLVISIRARQSRRRYVAVRDSSSSSGAGTAGGNGNSGASTDTAHGSNCIGADTNDKIDRTCDFAVSFANRTNLIETEMKDGFGLPADQNEVVHLNHPNQHPHQPIMSYPMQQFNQQVSALGIMQVPNQSVSYSSTSSSSSFRGCGGADAGGGYNTWHHHHGHNHVHTHNHNPADSSQVTTTSPGDESMGGGTTRRSVNKQLKFDLLNAPKRYDTYSKNSILSNNNKGNAYSSNSNDNNSDNDNMFTLTDSGFLDPNDLTIKVEQVRHSTFQMNDYGANRQDCSTNTTTATTATTPMGYSNHQHHCQSENGHHRPIDNNSVGTINSPQYGSQSTATTTTTTTTNNNGDNLSYDHNRRTGMMQYVYDPMVPASGSSYHIQYNGNRCNNNSSNINDTNNLLLTATSPSSSTTLSLTPMQLEHLVASGSSHHGSSTGNMEHATFIDGTDVICDYQIEPIGLLCAVSQQQQQAPIKSSSNANGDVGDGMDHQHHNR